MSDDDKADAEEKLNRSLKAARHFVVHGNQWEKIVNREIAENVRDRELGRFNERQPNYRLDEATRDRLIVHARQDAAHALLNTASLMDGAWRARKAWSGSSICIVVSLMVLTACIWLTKPTCRDGYVATIAAFNGWICAPGYKP